MNTKTVIKRTLTLILSITAIASPLTFDLVNTNNLIEIAYAESGESESVKWSLENGILTISGSGEMSTSSLSIPWKDSLDDITSVVIESGITNVGSFAFRNCSNLVSVSLPDTITVIERNAFKGCSLLSSINFPDGLKSIERSAFSDCSALTEVSFPNTLVSIGESAFEGCTNLSKVIIPDSVTEINNYAFENCSSVFIICCSFGSAAFSYAKANGHRYDDSYSFEIVPEETTEPVSTTEPYSTTGSVTTYTTIETTEPENDDTFVIASKKDFNMLPYICSDYKYISLEADITAPAEWTSIKEFNGTFNGNGYSITGLTNSLFEKLGSAAVIDNLILSDVKIDISTGGSPVGAICCENLGRINNCSVTGEIDYYSTLVMNSKITWLYTAVFPDTFKYFCAGGITGINSGTIEGCINSAKIRVSNTNDLKEDHGIYYAMAGGIVAENNGSVNNCTNLGDVYSTVSSNAVMNYGSNKTREGYTASLSGGITGFNKGSVSGCKSIGAYASNYNYSTGKNVDSTTKDEEASYSLSPAMYVYSGGIAGAMYYGTISQCSVSDIGETLGNLGARMEFKASAYDSSISRSVNMWCGGIAGVSFGNSTIDQCSNRQDPHVAFGYSGTLDTLNEGVFCGGILGAAYYNKTSITNCYNMGILRITAEYPKVQHVTHINGGFLHGGILGVVCNSNIYMDNTIESYKGSASVMNCYSIAPSSRYQTDTGDSFDYNYALFNENTQPSLVTGNATFNNCYYIDTLNGKVGTKISESEMKSQEFVSQLGEAFVYEPDSYPMLSWEKKKTKGDVNADRYLTVADLVLLKKWLNAVSGTKLPDYKAADIFEDDILNVFDLVLLKRELMKNM